MPHCRQHTGLGYHSGDDIDASGPLNTQALSFTANPPMSSTGNTSPTQESSVIGVTAQLGMRLNELKGLQSEHERVAHGQYDSNGEMSVAPEPLGVTYGKKIGVGGFGAVYEGQWSGKEVAIKVRSLFPVVAHAQLAQCWPVPQPTLPRCRCSVHTSTGCRLHI
jgi:hypothetical protein